MTEEKQKAILAAIESLICYTFRPTFLALTIHPEFETIEIVMSTISFNYQSIPERVISVFNVIDKEMPHLMESHLILLQTFDSAQMERVLDNLFEEELERWM